MISGRPAHSHASERREQGSILIMTAVMMTMLLGFSALALDASYMYSERNRMASAADAAAKAAAFEYRRAGATADLQAFANREVSVHGFDPLGSTSVVVSRPPASGTYAGDASFVEVTVSKPLGTFFARVLGFATMTPGARAVAGTSSSTACLTTMSDMTWGNNNTITATGCGVMVGGDLSLGNNSILTASGVGVTGTASGGTVSPAARTGIPLPADPLPSLTAPADPGGSCSSPTTIGSNQALSAGKYCGWYFSSSATLTLNPGIYYVTGLVSGKNPGTRVSIQGTGVMIYLAPDGSIDLDSNGLEFNISAPTSGPYKGIAIYQDRANTADMVLGKNGGDVTIEGVLYAPGADIEMKNNGLTANPCSIVVANTITVKNNAALALDTSCGAYGGSPLLTITLAE